ncbi:acyl-CoA thioesterase II [Plantibacter sp. M259]|uniref:acyl-CoA thioesterase n=1 Tax=Plantibacter sp. M259 TaxID=2583822 RepID=UPI00143D8F36|nr:thioesterase family protein [Plantibacter sp. M259]
MSQTDSAASHEVREYLDSLSRNGYEAPSHLWGFGGLHGGLILAALTERAHRLAPGVSVRSVTGRFHRTIREDFSVNVSALKGRGSVLAYSTWAQSGDTVLADATVVLGAPQSARFPATSAPMPDVPAPADCDVFPVPREFVPASAQVEIRLAGPGQPYSGQSEPKLLAWVRVITDDVPPDQLRILFILDMLAPSYSAVLDSLVPMPTLELGVQFTQSSPADNRSPWVLVSAHTRNAPGDGWLFEEFDAWTEDGTHLAAARQIRIIRD